MLHLSGGSSGKALLGMWCLAKCVRRQIDRENTLKSSSKECKGLVRNLSQMSGQNDEEKQGNEVGEVAFWGSLRRT